MEKLAFLQDSPLYYATIKYKENKVPSFNPKVFQKVTS